MTHVEDGLVIIDKPTGKSSFAALTQVKRRLGVKKAGYLGTLDPMATGVLVVFIGRGTKLIRHFEGTEKEYEVEIELGKVSDTLDSTGRLVAESNEWKQLSEKEIERAVLTRVGDLWQVQPAFSAVRREGKRAYELARAGEEVELGKRQVTVHKVDKVDMKLPFLTLRMCCSSGTYVRAWVHEVGEKLGCGAWMTALKRTRVGPWNVGDAVAPGDVTEDDLVEVHLIREKWLQDVK